MTTRLTLGALFLTLSRRPVVPSTAGLMISTRGVSVNKANKGLPEYVLTILNPVDVEVGVVGHPRFLLVDTEEEEDCICEVSQRLSEPVRPQHERRQGLPGASGVIRYWRQSFCMRDTVG